MAQDFRRHTSSSVGTSAVSVKGGVFTNYDAIVGIRLANVHATDAIQVDVYINDGSNNIYIVKKAPVPVGGSLELIDGGSKIICTVADQLYVKSYTASSLDVWLSLVEAISS